MILNTTHTHTHTELNAIVFRMESYYLLETGRVRFHKGIRRGELYVYLMLQQEKRRKFTILRVHSSTMVKNSSKITRGEKKKRNIFIPHRPAATEKNAGRRSGNTLEINI